MWTVLLVVALLVLYAYGMTRGTAWLDQCSDEDFRLFIWESEPHQTADAVGTLIAQVLVIHVWATDPGRVWLRIEGWILFPWARRLEQICRQYLAESELTLDFSRVRWISPGGRRLLRRLDDPKLHIQRWPRHLRPLYPAAGSP